MNTSLFETECKKLLNSIPKETLPLITSSLGIINCACKIVEEVYLRLKESNSHSIKISGSEKKMCASNLYTPLIEKYFKFQLITEEQKNKFMTECLPLNVDTLVDTLITIWREENGGREAIKRGLFCLALCSKRIDKIDSFRPFKDVKIIENVE